MPNFRYQALGPLPSSGGSRAFLGLAIRDEARADPVVLVWVPDELAKDIEKSERIQRETERAALLEHPHIVRVYGFARMEDGRLARVVEFGDGENLRRVLEATGPLPAPLAARLVADAAQGVHYAHLAGNDDGTPLLHGDLRPETLLVTFAGNCKVAGYGAAAFAPKENRGRNIRAAPEQVLGGRAAMNVQTDVYLLGATLFEALTGKAPFEDAEDIDQAVLTATVDFSRHPKIPETLVPVLARALAKKAAERFPSALLLREAIELAVQPLPDEAEVGKWLAGHFPDADGTRAERQRLIDSGIAAFARAQWAREPASRSPFPSVAPPPAELGGAGLAAPMPAGAAAQTASAVGAAFAADAIAAAQAVSAQHAASTAPSTTAAYQAPGAQLPPAAHAASAQNAASAAQPTSAARAASAQLTTSPAQTGSAAHAASGAHLALMAHPAPAPNAASAPQPTSAAHAASAQRTISAGYAAPGARLVPAPHAASAQHAASTAQSTAAAYAASAAQPTSTAPSASAAQSSAPQIDLAPATGSAMSSQSTAVAPPGLPPSSQRDDDARGPASSAPRGSKVPGLLLGLSAVALAALAAWWGLSQRPPADAGGTSQDPGVIGTAPSRDSGPSVARGPNSGGGASSDQTGSPDAGATTEAPASGDAGATATVTSQGTLALTSEPTAAVEIDGVPSGRTPLRIKVAAGKRRIRLIDRKKGVDLTRVVLVPENGTANEAIYLQRGYVSVNAPVGAVIEIDGRQVGKAPLSAEISIYEGTHRVEVTVGTQKWRETFTVKPNQRVYFDVGPQYR